LQFPTDFTLNGTMGVNTTGIRTSVNCANPNQLTVTPSNANLSTISATSIDGCSLNVNINPTNAAQQYGVIDVPNCVVSSTTDVAFQPVRQFFLRFSIEREVLITRYRSSSGFGSKIPAKRPVFSADQPYSSST
jgi:hypothetical protein